MSTQQVSAARLFAYHCIGVVTGGVLRGEEAVQVNHDEFVAVGRTPISAHLPNERL
jgi:hypothetical protein